MTGGKWEIKCAIAARIRAVRAILNMSVEPQHADADFRICPYEIEIWDISKKRD